MNSLGAFVTAGIIQIAFANVAVSESRVACEQMLLEMGYSLGTYVHEPRGFFSPERHIFGPFMCSMDRDGNIARIERGNEIIAQDGIFGESAIRLRNEAERLHSMIVANARAQRDAAIEAARQTFRSVQDAENSQYIALERATSEHVLSLAAKLREGLIDHQAAEYLGISDDLLTQLSNDNFFQGIRESFESEVALLGEDEGLSQEVEPLRAETAALPDRTDLSFRAGRLRLGLSACEVVAELGEPDWIIFMGEDDDWAAVEYNFDVYFWDNAHCNPVSVDIEKDTGALMGWDEGRLCRSSREAAAIFYPSDFFRVNEQRSSGC